MADRPPKSPKTRSSLVSATLLDNPTLGRILQEVSDSTVSIGKAIKNRSVIKTSLVVGSNLVTHNLGKKAIGVNLCPTVADATFAWCFAITGDTQVTITIVNVAQPNCVLEIF